MIVDVIVPVYNAETTLIETISSVKRQTYSHFRIVAVDNGSTDSSYKILQREIGDENIYHVFEPKGPAAARNLGIQMSGNQFILPLDSDDLLEPRYLEKTLTEIHRTGAGFVSTGMMRFGEVNDYIPAVQRTYKDQLQSNQIPVTSLIRRSAFKMTPGYRSNLPGWEDWGLWLDILKQGWEMNIVNEPLFTYRCKTGGMNSYANQHKEELRQVMKSIHPEFKG